MKHKSAADIAVERWVPKVQESLHVIPEPYRDTLLGLMRQVFREGYLQAVIDLTNHLE